MESKEIYRGLIRLHILIEATRRPLDSAGLTARLRNHGLNLSLASTRRILRGFEGRGYFSCAEVRNSRPHKMYKITAAGRRQARDAKRRVRELIETFGGIFG
jgi:DNA-binding PadR family transcriptional regulator